MPGLLAIEEHTVCEVNRQLLTSKGDGDNSATGIYSRILGVTYPPISLRHDGALEEGLEGTPVMTVAGNCSPAQPDRPSIPHSLPAGPPGDIQAPAAQEPPGAAPGEQGRDLMLGFKQRARAAMDVVTELRTKVLSQMGGRQASGVGRAAALGWHRKKQRLAVAAAMDRILLYSFEPEGVEAVSEAAHDAHCQVLVHEFQCQVAALEWRPNAGGVLAAACRRGTCVWTLAPAGGGNHPAAPAGGLRRGGDRGTRKLARASMAFLRSAGHAPVTALAWSPDGRLLATASNFDPTIIIWDVATGAGTPVRRGLSGVSLLRWSPTGDYLFGANLGGTFHLWETATWASEPWSSSGGHVVSAEWSPDGRVLLAAFDSSPALVAIHFARQPPSLDAHLLPVEITQVTSDRSAGSDAAAGVELMAWDPSGERLAVVFAAPHGGEAAGQLVSVYDTRCSPVVAASFIGHIRGPEPGAKPEALAFHPQFKPGALLAVCWSNEECRVYPMIFRNAP